MQRAPRKKTAALIAACACAVWSAPAEATPSSDPDAAPFYLEFMVGEVGGYKFVGLNHDDVDHGYADLDYAFYFYNGNLQIWESGVQKYIAADFATTDIFQIVVAGGVVSYLQNEEVIYTSNVTPIPPLFVDTSFYGVAETINAIRMTNSSGVLVPVVSWISSAGVVIDGNNLASTTTPSHTWGAHGAASSIAPSDGTLSGNGALRFKAGEIGTNKFIGLSHGDSSQHYDDIDFALYFYGSGAAAYVFENGVYKAWGGGFSTSDTFEVEVAAGAVRYKKNGTVFYASTQTPNFPLIVDSAFHGCIPDESIKDVTLSEDGGAPHPLTFWSQTVNVIAEPGKLTSTMTPVCSWGAHGAASKVLASPAMAGPAGDRVTWSCANQYGAHCYHTQYADPLATSAEVEPYLDNAALNWGCPASSFGGSVAALSDGFSKTYAGCGTVYWTSNQQAAYFVGSGAIKTRYDGLGADEGVLGLPVSNPIIQGNVSTQIFTDGVLTYKNGETGAYYAAGISRGERAVIDRYVAQPGSALAKDLDCTLIGPSNDPEADCKIEQLRSGYYLELIEPSGLTSYITARKDWKRAYRIHGLEAQLWDNLGFPIGELAAIGSGPNGTIEQQQFERGYLVRYDGEVTAYNAGVTPRLATDTDFSMYAGPVNAPCNSSEQQMSVYAPPFGYASAKGRFRCDATTGFYSDLSLELETLAGETRKSEVDGIILDDWLGGQSIDDRFENAAPFDDLPPGTVGPMPEFADAELSMAGTGRIRLAPYGRVFLGRLTNTSLVRKLGVRAACVEHEIGRDKCDPSIVVLQYSADDEFEKVYYDRNVDSGEFASTGVYTHGEFIGFHFGAPQNDQNAELIIDMPNVRDRKFYVLAYSATRGTSRISLNFSTCLNRGCQLGWSRFNLIQEIAGEAQLSSRRDLIVGGTMVDLGYVNAGETFDVAMEGNIGESNIRRWIFNVDKNQSAFTVPIVPGVGSAFTFDGDWVAQSPAERGHTLALIGEQLNGQGLAAEKYTDVTLTSPQQPTGQLNAIWRDCNNPQITFPGPFSMPYVAGNARRCVEDLNSHSLPGGNYLFGINVHLSDGAIGDTTLGQNVAPGVVTVFQCTKGSGIVHIERGQGNDLAFELQLFVDGQYRKSRWVPRGAIGSKVPFDNLITLSYVQPIDGAFHNFQLKVNNVGPGVVVDDQYDFTNNPEMVTFTAVTQNLEFFDDTQHTEDLENSADVLGGGPDFFGAPGAEFFGNPAPNAKEVRYRKNRGPFRYEADLIAMQEIGHGNSHIIHDALNAMVIQPWLLSGHLGVSNGVESWSERYSPVFVRPTIASNFPLVMAGGNDIIATGVEPWLPDFDYFTHPHAISARRVRSDGGVDQTRIVVYSLYLPSNSVDIAERKEGIENLADKIVADMGLEANRFNQIGENSASAAGNRIIILGDSNMFNHTCSEINESLKVLRDRFGYAIDASQAAVDEFNRTYDNHYNFAPLSSFNVAGILDPMTGNPFNFLHRRHWEDLPEDHEDRFRNFHDGFSWWSESATYDGASDGKHDLVLLVGRGWAQDDPIVSFRLPPNYVHPHPMNNHKRNVAMDLRHYCGDAERIVGDSTLQFRPRHLDVCENPDTDDYLLAGDPELHGSGALAYRTDHKPVVVKLRTLMRR